MYTFYAILFLYFVVYDYCQGVVRPRSSGSFDMVLLLLLLLLSFRPSFHFEHGFLLLPPSVGAAAAATTAVFTDSTLFGSMRVRLFCWGFFSHFSATEREWESSGLFWVGCCVLLLYSQVWL